MPAGEMIAPLRERPFRLLFFAQATSMVGDQIAPIAVAFAVLDLTGSASDLGLALAARTLPLVVFVLAGGVWADRVSRHRLMMLSDIGRLVTQGLLAALLIAGVAEVWEVIVLQAANGTATAFFRPASTGLTPATVKPENLQNANALILFTLSAAQVLGPAIGGALVATLGAGWGIAADAGTFAASAVFLSRIRLPDRVETPDASFLSDLRGGWDAVRARTWLWVMILLFALFQVLVLATFFVLGPVIADRDLGGAGAWAFITGGWGAGAVLGALAGMRLRFDRPLVACNTVVILVVPPMLLMAVGASTAAVAVAAVGAGFGMSLGSVIYETAFQENVPDEVLSRAAAYDWMGSTALRPLGYAAVGPLATQVGVGTTLGAAGVATVAVMLGSLAVPSIRELRARAPSLPSSARRPDGSYRLDAGHSD
jgi:MFS family permease